SAHEHGERTHYLCPGLYIDRLEEWLAKYGANQVRTIVTEDLRQLSLARSIMRQLQDYLGLPDHDYADILARRFNHAPPADITPSLRASLAAFYHPYNVRLQECLGRDLPWD
ncbi:MAG: hypothetical protein ACREA0_05350, partial [bacterium]